MTRDESSMFVDWLRNRTIEAIVYLCKIGYNRKTISPNRIHTSLQARFSTCAGAKVAIATTFWDQVKDVDQKKHSDREEELLGFWESTHRSKPVVMLRHDNTSTSAFNIVKTVLGL
jgi:hypothetical protein